MTCGAFTQALANVTALAILDVGDRFEVLWVDAPRVPTLVVEFETFGDGSDETLEREPVRSNVLLSVPVCAVAMFFRSIAGPESTEP
jgi:hypothetical protein